MLEIKQMQKQKFSFYQDFKAEQAGDDIYIRGYASTFGKKPDRQGDIIEKTAYNDTVDEYMRNPVLLADHTNATTHVIGKVTKLSVTSAGLEIEAVLSKAADEFMQSIRTKISEGLLRAFSVGGMFFYDGNVIKQIKLYEISVVPVPANSDALFEKKSFDAVVDDFEANLAGKGSGERSLSTQSKLVLDDLISDATKGKVKNGLKIAQLLYEIQKGDI